MRVKFKIQIHACKRSRLLVVSVFSALKKLLIAIDYGIVTYYICIYDPWLLFQILSIDNDISTLSLTDI